MCAVWIYICSIKVLIISTFGFVYVQLPYDFEELVMPDHEFHKKCCTLPKNWLARMLLIFLRCFLLGNALREKLECLHEGQEALWDFETKSPFPPKPESEYQTIPKYYWSFKTHIVASRLIVAPIYIKKIFDIIAFRFQKFVKYFLPFESTFQDCLLAVINRPRFSNRGRSFLRNTAIAVFGRSRH